MVSGHTPHSPLAGWPAATPPAPFHRPWYRLTGASLRTGTSATLCDMSNGSEPRRRRWSSDSSRRVEDQDDAENWLAGFRPDSADDAPDPFAAPPPGKPLPPDLMSPPDQPPPPDLETTGRHGRRRREEAPPEAPGFSSPQRGPDGSAGSAGSAGESRGRRAEQPAERTPDRGERTPGRRGQVAEPEREGRRSRRDEPPAGWTPPPRPRSRHRPRPPAGRPRSAARLSAAGPPAVR